MFKNGSDGPTAVIEIWSIGVFDAERNKKYAKDIFKYITKELKNIPENRFVAETMVPSTSLFSEATRFFMMLVSVVVQIYI